MRLTAAVVGALGDHARRDLPREACGLLLGPVGGLLADQAVPSPNLAPVAAHDTFEIDTALHLACQREARAAGRRVVGIYHSHPGQPPVPSARDVAGAWDESLIWVIIGTDAMTIRAWQPRSGGFIECDIEVVP